MAADIGTYALDAFEDGAVQDIIEQNTWMESCEFRLLTKKDEVTEFIDRAIEKGVCAVDLETDGLNTRAPLPSLPTARIVGVCLSVDVNEGIYIPVRHDDTEYNVPEDFIAEELNRLVMNCICVYHNFKYDGAVLYNYNIYNTDHNMYEDTMIMASIVDASKKSRGLKHLSEVVLNRPMVEIDGLGITGNTKKVVAFNMVHPRKAVYYGGSDAMNTLALYEHFKKDIDEQDPTGKAGPWTIYKVEKKCLYVTMEMERNLVNIDIPYLKEQRAIVEKKCDDLLNNIYEGVGRKFDVNSPKQLGTILFEELKIPYPKGEEKTASGQYKTSEAVLEKLESDNPIANMILTYRHLVKFSGTYLTNLIENADENNQSRFQLNQNRADTGRFTASGGKGLRIDGYSGVNCQNIPVYRKNDPNSVDIRRALRAAPGKKIVTIDYSGEELRIATNLSKEPNWIHEFVHGSADLHTITAKAIYQKDTVTKEERGKGKTLNFLTVYGGGPGGFSQLAKVPYNEAKEMQANFFKENKGLAKWIKDEAVRARKRGHSKTALGRRRPLGWFYKSGDSGDQAKGDRCAINSAVQGTGADIIKIALYRVWKWIHEDPEREKDIRILMPIHDEIVYEITETKLDVYIPELSEIMKLKDIVKALKWEVGFEVDAEYGDTLSITHDFKDYYENGEYERILELKKKEPWFDPEKELERYRIATGGKKAEVDEEDSAQEESSNPKDSTSEEPDADFTADVTKPVMIEVEENVKEHVEIEEAPETGESIQSDSLLKDRIDPRDYFNYTLLHGTTNVSALKLSTIFKMLGMMGDTTFVGPSKRIKILDSDGEVLIKTTNTYSIDAFVALCLWNEL